MFVSVCVHACVWLWAHNYAVIVSVDNVREFRLGGWVDPSTKYLPCRVRLLISMLVYMSHLLATTALVSRLHAGLICVMIAACVHLPDTLHDYRFEFSWHAVACAVSEASR